MKKYIKIIIILCINIPNLAFSREMCLPNDTVSIVLNSSIGGSGGSSNNYDNTNQTWNASFSYGVVRGIAACLSSNYGLGSYGIYTDNGGTLTDNGAVVTGGEANGNHCWCKLLHPAVSAWVYDSSYGYADAAECTRYGTTQSGCAQRCSGHFATSSTNLSKSIYKSIEN